MTASAVDREAAWLGASGDGLPALVESAGGPFASVEAYVPAVTSSRERLLHVSRVRFQRARRSAQRMWNRHQMSIRVWWPLRSALGSAQIEQRNFDAALDLVTQRITAFTYDKTHGGRFLSVAENPHDIVVSISQPEDAWSRQGQPPLFHAEVTYWIDDFEETPL
jgi:hypothetical protein